MRGRAAGKALADAASAFRPVMITVGATILAFPTSLEAGLYAASVLRQIAPCRSQLYHTALGPSFTASRA